MVRWAGKSKAKGMTELCRIILLLLSRISLFLVWCILNRLRLFIVFPYIMCGTLFLWRRKYKTGKKDSYRLFQFRNLFITKKNGYWQNCWYWYIGSNKNYDKDCLPAISLKWTTILINFNKFWKNYLIFLEIYLTDFLQDVSPNSG